MKEAELRKLATCAGCNRKIGQTLVPIFWKVTIQRFGLDREAIQRQQGLATILGGSGRLASAMGPDEDMARPLSDEATVMVCEECAFLGSTSIGEIGLRVESAQANNDSH